MFKKLKREWKTFVWGVVTLALSGWEFVTSSYLEWGNLIPEKHRPAAMVIVPLGFFFLRKWKDNIDVPVVDTDESNHSGSDSVQQK